MDAIEADDRPMISAGTMAETLIVAGRRNLQAEALDLIEQLELMVITVTETSAQGIGNAYSRWGRGVHPAGLNFGDCFSYELAMVLGCPLLYVGNDFAKTDVASAL